MMFFSIIIPNLDTPTVDEAILAIERQDYYHSQYELIVVGMDRFGLIHESDITHFIRSDQPLSPAKARNRGASQAKGEVLVFTDADCIPYPNWLSVLARRFASPDVEIVGGGVEFDTSNYWTLSDNLSMFYEYHTTHANGERSQLPSLNLAIRRSLFNKAGGFDERYPRPAGEDADLTIRLRKLGQHLWLEPTASVFHRPPRGRLVDILQHGFYQGKYSTKVDPRYSAEEGLPWLLRTRCGVFLSGPILGAVVTLRIFFKYRNLRKYWYTSPAIYLTKLAWCVGAANRPNWQN
jgi:cellulose synthase/poly-beta-1,6-N-acetylglucosamine synthase-like glycosyltransferase